MRVVRLQQKPAGDTANSDALTTHEGTPHGGGGFPTTLVGENQALVLGSNVYADTGIVLPNTDYFWIEMYIGAQGGPLNMHRRASYTGASPTSVGATPMSTDRVRGDMRADIQFNYARLHNGDLAASSVTAATYSIRVWT